MRTAILVSATAFAVLMASVPSYAQDPHGHDQGIPATQAAPPSASQPSPAKPSAGELDEHMKQMQSIHQRLMNAKTPEERERAMKDARKAMQDGMASMHGLTGAQSALGPRPGGSQNDRMQTMEKRMDMMQMMMQMMIDEHATEAGDSGAAPARK